MPVIDDGTTHEQITLSIYSNNGASLIYSNSADWYTGYDITVTEKGIAQSGGAVEYDHGKNILGFSTSANATEPTYAVGDTFQVSADTTLYVIEAETTTSGVTVEYNGSVVATIPNGYKATLPIADKEMKTDIVITVPSAESGTDSAVPIEVSTEAEMTALLESGEVGGVYKYTGETTDTYENGALYVLEAELITFTIDGTEYQAEEGMTWAEWVESEYNTDGYIVSSASDSSGYPIEKDGYSYHYVYNPDDRVHDVDKIVAKCEYHLEDNSGTGSGSN